VLSPRGNPANLTNNGKIHWNKMKLSAHVTNPVTTHYAKLHALLADYSPLHVALFTDRGAVAKAVRPELESVQ
jgi:hypothetical protein